MFGFGTFTFGYRLLDRRSKVIVNNAGILDTRNCYDLIPWNEISGFRMWSVKGNYYITLGLRDPNKWIAKASVLTRVIAHIKKSKKFSITVGLQNMVVDESALKAFISEMLAVESDHA